MSRIVFFLGGQSYPDDQHVEASLRAILQGARSQFVSQSELQLRCGALDPPASIAERLALLNRVVPTDQRRQDVILVGRSAGARAVSLFACLRPVSAVICVSYPFRGPGLVLEPERFAHLATIATPTLILQGAQDPYGGLEITETYRFSAAVTLRFCPGDHRTDPSDAPAREIIRQFAETGWRQPTQPDPWFDEAFYLERHADVAQAVAAGGFASGQDHYHRQGRQEGRAFRVRAEAVGGEEGRSFFKKERPFL
jgi:predicted alpha/beta-hydrolase family hydrolase